MSKDNIADFDSTPVNNSDIGGINIAENCPPSNINNAIRQLMTAIKAGDWGGANINANAATATRADTLKQGGITAPTSAGTSTAYTVTSSPVVTAYTSGAVYQFKAHTASGDTPTVNFDGLGAKALKIIDKGAKISVRAGDIASGALVQCLYDGTDMVATAGMRTRGFSAIKSTNQTGVASAAYTKVVFPAEEWDTDGWYDAANSRFTPPAGYYSIKVQVQVLAGLDAGAVTRLALYKNGSLPSPVINVSDTLSISASDIQTFLLVADVYASGTDYFEVYIRSDGGTTKTLSAGASFFRAFKIS